MAFCLIKTDAAKLLKAFKDGSIDPGKLSEMTSEERNTFFQKYTSKENATKVNALFESKQLLKNQKQGYITWAKQITGISSAAKRDIITRIQKMERVLSPQENEQFLKDLAQTKLGLGVSQAEAKIIFDLSKKVQDTEAKRDPKNLTFKTEAERLDYGSSKVAINNYINELKIQAERKTIAERAKNPLGTISEIAGTAKSLKASFDISALLRQGWKTLWTNPGIWAKNSAKSFFDFARTIKDGEKVIDAVMADIVSRPNYDRMVQAKIAIGNLEEAFPSTLPENIPLIGRVFKASNTSFTGFLYRQRADIFDAYINIMDKYGLDINDKKELISIGKVINSLTGRGNLGALEPAANVINNVFFSPRYIKSHIDFLTAHAFDKDVTSFAKKQAAVNLVKVILGTSAVLIIAKAINSDSVEEDPRSADFGKIKIGNTRFDFTGGMSSLATLVFRQISGASKSSSTGRVAELNSGNFGSQTRLDVLYDFFENKLSPVSSVVRDLLKGEDFNGNKPTVLGELNNLFMPLPITNYKELSNDPNSAPILLAMLADAVGIGTNTYGKSEINWKESTSKELLQFKERVTEKEFDSANKKFNQMFDEWAQKVYRMPEFQNLSNDAKQKVTSDAKDKIKEKVLKDYGFKYKTKTKDATQKKEDKTVKDLVNIISK